MIAEIAASSASYDLHSKLRVYRRNGVQEYLVVLTEAHEVRGFVLQDGAYVQLTPDAEGILHSERFPGLWLDTSALLTGNMARVLEVLQQGFQRQEHRIFVQHLREARDRA